MIIVVCTDDQALMEIAAEASVSNPNVFGRYYRVFAQQIPALGRNENLFILAHGVADGDDEDNPVIGDKNNDLFLNALQLFENLQNLLPTGWTGSVYVSACESYDGGVDDLSFAEVLLAVMQPHFSRVRVFGHEGSVVGVLPLPGNRSWLEAARTHSVQGRKTKAVVEFDSLADGDPNGEMIKKIYSKISEVVSIGSSIQAPGNSFLTLASPGIFVDPKLDLSNADDEFLWASILNRIPLPTFIFGDSGQSLDSLYAQILQGKELPHVELTPSQKKQLNDALNTLMDADGNSTAKFDKYFIYQDEYYTALTTYQEASANANNEGKPIPPKVQAALKTAKQKWTTFGFKAEIEKAVGTVANLQGLDPNSWWDKLQDRFDNFQRQSSSGDFAITNTFPKYANIFQDSGWTSFNFNQSDFVNQESNSSTKTGGGVSANYGLFRASAEASYSKDEGYKKSSSTSVKVSVELFRLQINRPWLDALVFRSRAWRWSANSPFAELISNGADASQGQTPDGVMPLFPTTVIIAKNLVLEGDFSEEEQKWMSEKLDTKASFGWGPFSVSGNYSQSKDSKQSEGRIVGTKISNPDPQIIGWMCNVLPLSPNPDPKLPWPSDMTLAHLPEYRPFLLEQLRSKKKMVAALTI